MNYLDIFFVVIFILGAVKGYLKGLIVELFSFFAFFIGLFIAVEFTVPISKHFFSNSDYFQLLTVAIFVGMFLLVIVVINLIAKLIKKALDLTFLGIFDNILGALAAVFKWAFILSVLFWVIDSIGLRLPTSLTDGSFFYDTVKVIAPVTFNWLASILPFFRDMIDSMENIVEKDRPVYTFL